MTIASPTHGHETGSGSAHNSQATSAFKIEASNDPKESRDEAPASSEDTEYPSGLRLALILMSTFICMFLTALDRLIVVTAVPQISDKFHSVNDIGWYGSAYLLLQCSSLLLFGKIYTFFSLKATFLTSLFFFELGSAVSGAAPISIAFIIGRAIAGLGAAGIQCGVVVVIVCCVPLYKRPMYQGLFGAVFGIASVVGPLVGGALTSHASWRWCFYINLPLGGVAAVVVFFLLRISDQRPNRLPLMQRFAQLDVCGTTLVIAASICLVLALQWGGSQYSWKNARIIVLLTLSGVFYLGFVLAQIFLPETATIAPRIVKHKSVVAGVFATFCLGAQLMIISYYLPIWFQGIQGVSAVESGIRFLPTMLSVVVASIITGVLIRRVGYYTPFMIIGVCLMSVGGGLLYTLQVYTPSSKWIGYQILYGIGAGSSLQSPNIAAQTVLPKKDVPVGISMILFSQLIGGTIFLPVAQNVLSSQLLRRLSSIPGLDSGSILNTGATELTDLPASVKGTVLIMYNESLRHVFMLALILACIGMLGAFSLEWRSVKQDEGAAGEKGVENT